jgi:parvulin-like peptidyl-prolyl isomerase
MSTHRLTSEHEAEVQELAKRIREAAADEFLQMARQLVGKKTSELFGKTEFQIRDILVRVGAKVYEEYLREKKMGMKAPE